MLNQLKFIYLNFAGIMACYYAVYGFMPTVRSKNEEPASWLAKSRDYIVCAVCVSLLAHILSYKHGVPDEDIAITRFVEFIIPAFYGMYRANRKDAKLTLKERIDIWRQHEDSKKNSNLM